jgi:hypothetical protein
MHTALLDGLAEKHQLAHQYPTIRGVVVDHEHAPSFDGGWRGFRSGLDDGVTQSGGKPECRALAYCAIHARVAAHQF